ncbi:MAG: ABC transporter substrate-binding protein [Desulfovibrio sp.]|nr:ABC transporter substrate-binding protein [Desulfovibrio sp.]MBI4959300.1 ABC transporter substrate-binding protein [Desulfovibrio sp.]
MKRQTLLVGLTIAAAMLAVFCRSDPAIVIGFSGQLTGTFSDLGVQGRNGATLAIEDVNASGGVAGSRLKLIAVDDGNTPEGAIKADESLLASGAVAIVGHMTSSQTMAAMPLIEERRAVLVSPTTATPALTGKTDMFFRLIPDNQSWAKTLAEFSRSKLGLSKVYMLGDSDNISYVESFNTAFMKFFTQMGGAVAGSVHFSSKDKPDWRELLQGAEASGAQAVVMAASARDVAQFAKARALAGSGMGILCPTWPYTREILLAGGDSVEGIIFSTSYTEENDSPAFQDFRKRYEDRFGWPANFAAAYSYEAVKLIAQALRITKGQRQGLEQALVSTGQIQGVIGDFALDQAGDVNRENFIVTIRDARFRTVQK